MPFTISREQFLCANRISEEDFEKAAVPWETLAEIAEDHLSKHLELSETAALCARVMQKLPGVHSVRWRVKDVEHLLEKIVRKLADDGSREKYVGISASNYHDIVTDLVGLRPLHLFKGECFAIDAALREAFILHDQELPVAYVREGDPRELNDRFTKAGLRVKNHPAGYRSVHYVIASQPLQRRTLVEVQVRTIFEEGWSEIDHKIRYPNFSDNPQVSYFLRIFNRQAGSADEMGTFVQGLVEALETSKTQVDAATQNYEETLRKLEETVAALDAEKNSSKLAGETVAKLKNEVKDLRSAAKKAEEIRALPLDMTAAQIARHGISLLVPGIDSILNAHLRDKEARIALGLSDSVARVAAAPTAPAASITLAKAKEDGDK